MSFLLLILSPSPGAAVSDQPSCVQCHSKIAHEYADSAHADMGMTCVSCHGGDPTNMEASAMSHGAGFRGAPSRERIPPFCGDCHANRPLMKQYGLPTHQLEDYKSSEHGRAWARGDTHAALCTDCHGSHAILPADDTRSSVYETNVPATCGRCHGDEELTARYGLPADVFEKYRESVHGVALLVGENKAAPSCASCHGSHGALPPAAVEIGNVCGQCHRSIVERLRKSAHAAAVRDGALTECISCHGHHVIRPADPSMLQELCAKCHPPGSRAAQESGRMYELISGAQRDFDEAEAAVHRLREAGYTVAELQSHLEEAHTKLVQTADVQHLLVAERVERYTIAVTEAAGEVEIQVARMHAELRTRKVLLGVLWLVLVVMVGMLLTKRARASRELTPSPTDGGGR